MQFTFHNRSDAQIKRFHDSKMLYNTYIELLRSYNLSYRYKMIWQKHKNDYELLAKVQLGSGKRKYLGRRSKETEKIKEEFNTSKLRAKERLNHLKEKLVKNAKMNKLEGIARAPKELVAIFSKINELGLDDKLIAIGTSNLYAYEAKCGVAVEQEQLAIRDIDLFNKKDKGLSFILKEFIPSTKAIDFLHMIDKSFFKSDDAPYRFINRDGIWVELINPMSDSFTQESYKDNPFADVIPLAMNGMHWLENSQLFKETVIGEDGRSANITTIHPLEFAIYKAWLSKQEDRDYQKHVRDKQQSLLVTQLIIEYMLDISIKDEVSKLRHLKKEVVDGYMDEVYVTVQNSVSVNNQNKRLKK